MGLHIEDDKEKPVTKDVIDKAKNRDLGYET